MPSPDTPPAETQCPECKGKGSWFEVRHAQICGAIEDEETRAHFHHANCSEQKRTCRVCGGSGELVGVACAVYMARGGAPPIQRQGWA